MIDVSTRIWDYFSFANSFWAWLGAARRMSGQSARHGVSAPEYCDLSEAQHNGKHACCRCLPAVSVHDVCIRAREGALQAAIPRSVWKAAIGVFLRETEDEFFR